jgi:CRISPR-associated protein Csb2
MFAGTAMLSGGLLIDRAPMFNVSRRWRSVTPFSLPRFPNRGGGKPPRPRDLPEGQLIRELKNRGLPEPISIKPIEGYQFEAIPPYGEPTKRRGMVRWREFHTTRYNGTMGNGLAGFEIEFAEPVRGPIAVGFACHFGLGLAADLIINKEAVGRYQDLADVEKLRMAHQPVRKGRTRRR